MRDRPDQRRDRRAQITTVKDPDRSDPRLKCGFDSVDTSELGLKLRGPIGGYFVWGPGDGGPMMLLAGGSGVVPLRSMLRHRLSTGSNIQARLLCSSRSWKDVIYREELSEYRDGLRVSYTLTRSHPAEWSGHTGRIDSDLLAEVAWPAAANPLAYICGPTCFVETAAAGLVELGYPPERVGPS